MFANKWYYPAEMSSDKLSLFYKTTEQLLNVVDTLHLKNADTVRNLVARIRAAFLSEDIRKQVFGSDVAAKLKRYPANGYCGAASFAFVSAINDKNWQVMYINETWTYGPHFYLFYKPTKTVLDITVVQFAFDGITEVPYWMGQKANVSEYPQSIVKKFAVAIVCTDTKNVINQQKAR